MEHNTNPDGVMANLSRREGLSGDDLADAACVNSDPRLFDPRDYKDPNAKYRYSTALRACAGCPVRQACYDMAVSWGDAWGIFGGVMFADGRTAWQPSMGEEPPTPAPVTAASRIVNASTRDRLDRDRRIWTMHKQGMPREVIAERAGVTERTVERSLRRVRQQHAKAKGAEAA